jgi:glycosyltransferase involved in cell wall biosynthesis
LREKLIPLRDDRKGNRKAKAARRRGLLSELYIFIIAIRVELTCNDFSASFRFELCGLRGFPPRQGLDSFSEWPPRQSPAQAEARMGYVYKDARWIAQSFAHGGDCVKPKVIMLTGSAPPEACGVGDYTFALVSALESAGFRAELLCHKQWDIRGTGKLFSRLSQEKEALLHIQYPTFGYGYSLGPQLSSLARRSVITLHEFSLAHILRKVSLCPFTVRSSRLVMTAEFECRMLTRSMPWAKQKITIIPIGSNIAPSQPASLAPKPRILYHGLIMPRKGLEEWIALARLARERNAGWEFMAVGKIPAAHASYGENLIRTSSAGSVKWVLDRTDEEVAALFSEGGIAYLPFVDGASERRGSLKAVLAAGLPTITTASAQTPENLNGAVLFARDREAAFDCARRLMESLEERCRLAKAALEYSQLFSWRKIAESHIRMYEELFSRGSRDLRG